MAKHSYRNWKLAKRDQAHEPGAQAPGPGQSFRGVITAVNEDEETVTITHWGGPQLSNIRHPYLGAQSWIRVMPEDGVGVFASHRSDTDLIAIDSYDHDTGHRVENYKGDKGSHYRRLRKGEIEISSRGLAQAFFGRSGNLELRGGITWMHLRNQGMTIESMAPLHRRSHPWRSHGKLGWEERFGVVNRPGTVASVADRFINAGPIPAVEYYRAVSSLLPTITDGNMVEHHEGNLLDANGLPILGGPMNLPLRARSRWRTETRTEVTAEIDMVGNVSFKLPETAVSGFTVKSLLGIKLDTTGALPTTLINMDGVSWFHYHPGPFGPTGQNISMAPIP